MIVWPPSKSLFFTINSIMNAVQVSLTGKKILIVETNIDFGFALAQLLKETIDCQVIFATSTTQAFKIVDMTQPHLFFVNDHLSGTEGESFIKFVHSLSLKKRLPVVFMSDQNTSLRRPLPQSIVTLRKPFGREELLYTLNMLLTQCMA